MAGRPHNNSPDGFTLIEVLVTLCVLAVLVLGSTAGAGIALDRQQARGAAQVCQAAFAWAQSRAIWSGTSAVVQYDGGSLSVQNASDHGAAQGDVSAPQAETDANVLRWRLGGGVALTFGSGFGSPDSGGSLYFGLTGGRYRLIVRPESGLTVREAMGQQ